MKESAFSQVTFVLSTNQILETDHEYLTMYFIRCKTYNSFWALTRDT